MDKTHDPSMASAADERSIKEAAKEAKLAAMPPGKRKRVEARQEERRAKRKAARSADKSKET